MLTSGFLNRISTATAVILAQTVVYLRSKIHDIDKPMYTLFTKFHS